MSIFILTAVVLAEVLLFQVFAALANRTLMRQETRSLASPVPDAIARHADRAPRRRVALGIGLAVVALLPAGGLIADPVAGKLLVAMVALVSAAAFASALATDRRIMRALADLSPGGQVRRASLTRRAIRDWYPPALEAVPVAIFVATTLFLLSAAHPFGASGPSDHPGGDGRSSAYLFWAIQGVFVAGALFRTLQKGVSIEPMTTHIPSLRRRPEAAMRLGEQLAGLQLRYFLFAKIAISVLLGAAVVDELLAATGEPAAVWSALRWSMVGVLLVAFFFYLRQVGRVSRRMQDDGELPSQEAAGIR